MCDADGSNLLRCNITKKGELAKAENGDMRQVARWLAARASTTSPSDFKALQQALGVTHHEHAILLDRRLDGILKPVDQYLHDWMHGFCCGWLC